MSANDFRSPLVHSNPYFYSANDQVNRFPSDYEQKKDQQMVKNKLTKSRVANSFTSVLSCRLREGYTVKTVNYPTRESP